MARGNLLTQKVNFFISAAFIAVFGLFLTTKILDISQHADPITQAVAETADALAQK